MQIIIDTEAVFDVTVNPFLKLITIEHIGSSIFHQWNYEELDEWHIFHFSSRNYDFHFLYDEHLEFYAHPINDYEKTLPINLHIEF